MDGQVQRMMLKRDQWYHTGVHTRGKDIRERQRERERAHTHVPASLLLIWLWGLSHGSELLPVHVASFWTRTPGMSCRDSKTNHHQSPPSRPRYVLNSLHCKVPGSLQRKIDETPSLLFWPATHGYKFAQSIFHVFASMCSVRSGPRHLLMTMYLAVANSSDSIPIWHSSNSSQTTGHCKRSQSVCRFATGKEQSGQLERSQSFAALIKVVVANDVWMIQRAQEPEETSRRLRRISGNAYSASPVSSRLRVCVCLSCLLHHVVTLPFGFSPMCLIPNAQVNRVR